MKNITKYSILFFLLTGFLLSGCTLPSTKLAQTGSFRSQAVLDGVHCDMFKALSRENFETARLAVMLEIEKMKCGKSEAEQETLDEVAAQMVANLKEFAQKRDFMVEWDRDFNRGVFLKSCTVDQYLFAQIGIFNYLADSLSSTAKKSFNAWDEAKLEWSESVDD